MFTLTVSFVVGLWLVVHLNNERINDIQKQRISSCQKTYRAFPEMFQPFFPRERKDWTDEQRLAFTKLERRADELAAKCHQQTKTKGG